jgi:hypothetical protein
MLRAAPGKGRGSPVEALPPTPQVLCLPPQGAHVTREEIAEAIVEVLSLVQIDAWERADYSRTRASIEAVRVSVWLSELFMEGQLDPLFEEEGKRAPPKQRDIDPPDLSSRAREDPAFPRESSRAA